MPAPRNPFKEALKAGKPQIGLWVGLADPYTAEIVAGAGFDWLLIDGEHAPNDVRTVLAQLQAIAPYPSHPIARLPVGETALVKQYLDVGAQTLLIPMVETAEQAEALVRAVRYPPQGVRGVGSALARAARWGATDGYLKTANDEVCLLVQVESARGVENLDAIAAVEGVDGVFIGPSDLAASLGYLGDASRSEVQAVIDDSVARIVAAGKAPGILMTDPARARRYIDDGCLFVAVGVDTLILGSGARSLAASFRT